MISALTRETRYVQNPALGSVLIWRFAVAYTDAHPRSASPVVPLGFLVLPLLWHQDIYDLLRSTQKATGLHGFADKFSRSEVGKSDLLLAIHSRAETMKPISIESIRAAVLHRLLTIAPSDATLVPVSTSRVTGLAPTVKAMIDSSEKIGIWFARMSLFEIGATLKVSL